MRSKEPDKPDPIIDAVGRLFMDCSRVVREARYTVHVNKIRQLIPGGTWDVELATAEAIWAQEPSKPTTNATDIVCKPGILLLWRPS